MHIILMLLHIIGTTIIMAPTGCFDYEKYYQYEHVIEGTLVGYQDDSLTIEVTRVWSGMSEPGENLTFYHDYRVDIEDNGYGLFIADSSGRLSIHGLAREGFFILVGRSTPNILTVDDLQSLSNGEIPEFNQHQSAITLHFPLSSEEIEIIVIPNTDDRITISNFDRWNDCRAFGYISRGEDYLTEFSMSQPLDQFIFEPLSFAGDIRKYDDEVYHIDLWPKYPAFGSTASMNDYYEFETIPVYTFRIELEEPDYWLIGLPEECYMISDGNEFYLRGRQKFVPRNYYQRGSDSFDLLFPAFTSSGGSSSSRNTLLRLENLERFPRKPLLMTMLEAVEHGDLHGSLYFVESGDSEPVFYSECTVSLSSPSFLIKAEMDSSYSVNIDDSILSFTATGQAVLEYDGISCIQISDDLNLSDNQIQMHNSAVFEYPDEDAYSLLLHFSSIHSYTNHAYESDLLVARVIHHWLRDGTITGVLYLVRADAGQREEIGSFTMYRQ